MHEDRLRMVPLTRECIPVLWCWLHEFPLANLDDGGPKSLAEFGTQCNRRILKGEKLWEFRYDGHAVGVIGYAGDTIEKCGLIRGICFTKETHGTGIPNAAMRRVLERAFQSVDKVFAVHYGTNWRVAKFLEKFGAVEKGVTLNGAYQNGTPVSARIVEIDKVHFRALHGPRGDQTHHDNSAYMGSTA